MKSQRGAIAMPRPVPMKVHEGPIVVSSPRAIGPLCAQIRVKRPMRTFAPTARSAVSDWSCARSSIAAPAPIAIAREGAQVDRLADRGARCDLERAAEEVDARAAADARAGLDRDARAVLGQRDRGAVVIALETQHAAIDGPDRGIRAAEDRSEDSVSLRGHGVGRRVSSMDASRSATVAS